MFDLEMHVSYLTSPASNHFHFDTTFFHSHVSDSRSDEKFGEYLFCYLYTFRIVFLMTPVVCARFTALYHWCYRRRRRGRDRRYHHLSFFLPKKKIISVILFVPFQYHIYNDYATFVYLFKFLSFSTYQLIQDSHLIC